MDPWEFASESIREKRSAHKHTEFHMLQTCVRATPPLACSRSQNPNQKRDVDAFELRWQEKGVHPRGEWKHVRTAVAMRARVKRTFPVFSSAGQHTPSDVDLVLSILCNPN